ncbi:MAG: hypothetical protein ACLR8Y_17235 [Alistipes indistinctus]
MVIPNEVMEQGCLLNYTGKGFYSRCASEPLSCVIGAMHANYHITPGSYVHQMEIAEGGCMAILAGVGPMGLAAINYAIHRKDRSAEADRRDRYRPEPSRPRRIALFARRGRQERYRAGNT